MSFTFNYTYQITLQHYRYDTMGSERQWLPHGLRKETRNIKLTTTTLQSTKIIGSRTRILFHTRCQVRVSMAWMMLHVQLIQL